jgi:hypothetical protein
MAGEAPQDFNRAIDDLYAMPPDEFVARRDALAAAARSAGDAKLAAEIKKLRKPTVSAWAVNLLARRAHDTLKALLELGPALAKAQRLGRRDEMRTLGEARHRHVTSLVAAAGTALGEHGHPTSSAISLDIESTLAGALADADVAEAVLAGRLDRPVRYAGLGPVPTLHLVPTESAAEAGEEGTAGEPAGEGAASEPPATLRPAGPDLDRLAGEVSLASERHSEILADAERLGEERARLRREYDDLRSRLQQLEAEMRAADHAANQTRRDVSRAERDLERAKRMLDRARERQAARRSRATQ